MADLKLSTYGTLMSALDAVKSAAGEVQDESRRHAEAHFTHLASLRKDIEHTRAINDGIAKATG